MLIDVSCYAGHWPFRMLKNNSVQGVCDNAEKHGITHVVLASLNSVFYKDPGDGNRELMEEIKACKTPVKILPLAVVNPMRPNWEKFARKAILEEGFCGFEIFPDYHGYGFLPHFSTYERTYPAAQVMKLAKELDVPVRICVAFENYRQRHYMDMQSDVPGKDIFPLLNEYPGVSVIITGASIGSLGDDIKKYVEEHDNIFFDISRLDGYAYHPTKGLLNYTDVSHLCFGSLSPFQYIEPNLLKLVYYDDLKNQGIEADNIKKIFTQI